MHFYCKTPTGVEARHYVPVKSRPGDTRPTTLRDVKKWLANGEVVVPSVTTVLSVLDKGALTQWLVNQHLEQAKELAKEWQWATIAGEKTDENDFVREVKRRAKEEMDKAPEAGTAVHKSLEDYMLGGEPAPEHYEICRNVEAVLREKCGDVQWDCEKMIFDESGFAGCIDLSSSDWKIDYKTKETAEKFKPGKMAYESHSVQLAAYRKGDNTPKARCANIFVCIETGEVDFHEHTEEDLEKGWTIFENALNIYKTRNGL